jgi:hypothetical protein
MKKLVYFSFFCFIIFSGCEKNKKNCNCDNPLEDLAWLKEIKSNLTGCICEISIVQATFNNSTVFYTMMTDPLCDGVFSLVLLDCNGATVKVYNYDEFNIYIQEVKDIKVLYRCKD